ncbi:pyridoxal phosphate-dependent aminotransferase [Streptomyces tendae]|uniref:pyridoxal phosphate-dependent aminotransferase n=1 Tax=Streptomyces tendae TaxID=1932 RepID=UPI002490E3D1|nr:pyridoxal phosphate-dependent aminotransferase [Streptomyces tendae]
MSCDGSTPRRLDAIGQASSIAVNNHVYEMKAAGHDVITLSLGEAFFDLPSLAHPLSDGADLHHYTHSRGVPLLREKLAAYYREQCRVPVDPEREIIVTAGSKAAIFMALFAVVEPGDEVLVLEPLWVSYPDQIRLAGGTPVAVPYDVPVDGLEDYVTARTRAIVVNNPQNPSGRLMDMDEMRELHRLAETYGLTLIADEAYNEFVPLDHEFRSLGALDPEKKHTIVCNSMSKNYGISGWRVGYLIARPALTDQILKLQQHVITCAPSVLCHFLAENFETLLAVTRPQILEAVSLRNRMRKTLSAAGVETLPGNSTFYLFAQVGDGYRSGEEFARDLLRQHSVSVVPGVGYGSSCADFIRISVGTEPEARVVEGIDRIIAVATHGEKGFGSSICSEQ